jgi:hypothetical protein
VWAADGEMVRAANTLDAQDDDYGADEPWNRCARDKRQLLSHQLEYHDRGEVRECSARPVDAEIGKIVERDGFVFADVIPTCGRNRTCDASLASPP